MRLNLKRLKYLTFDCYGTLIDWETGILSVLRPMLARRGIEATPQAILHLYGEFEAQAERGPYRKYRKVLEQVVADFGARMGFEPTAEERGALAASLPGWKEFPGTTPELRKLAERYQLAIISNIDNDLFAATARQLQAPFRTVVTAEHARSYKPEQRHFELALERLGAQPEEVLHVAESLYHDIAPAQAMGWRCAWVNRRRPGEFGATPGVDCRPDVEVANLKSLLERVLK
jgi:2-haloacid dehalogenase